MQNGVCAPVMLTLIALVLASCATASSPAPNPVPAGHLYEGNYINVHVPNSEGWHLVNSTPSGIELARAGVEQGESFGAQVLIFPLPPTNSQKEFVAHIKRGFEADTYSSRFSVVNAEFEYSEDRSYPCVRVSSIVEDREAKISYSRREQLILQSLALYCRHPVRRDTGFGIIYSHRGKKVYKNLAAEAEGFISSVQVPKK